MRSLPTAGPTCSINGYLPYQSTEVFCDGNAPNAILPEKQAKADVLRVLKQYLPDLPVRKIFVWVKAHQDDHVAFDDLELLTQLNVRVDRL